MTSKSLDFGGFFYILKMGEVTWGIIDMPSRQGQKNVEPQEPFRKRIRAI